MKNNNSGSPGGSSMRCGLGLVLVLIISSALSAEVPLKEVDCLGIPMADRFFDRLSGFPMLFAPPRRGQCPQAAVQFRALRLTAREKAGISDCYLGLLASNLTSIVAAYAGMGVPHLTHYRPPYSSLAESGQTLLYMFGSRWPIFSLLAWVQAFRLCDDEPSPWWGCTGAPDPPGVRANSLKRVDQPFWDVLMDLAKRVADMRQEVVWVNSARVLFEPAVTLRDLLRPSALACPLGATVAIALHGLYNPWGGEHYADMTAFAARAVEHLTDRSISVNDIISSPWPLPAVFWQLQTKIDHSVEVVLHTDGLLRHLRSTPPAVGMLLGLCQLGATSALVVPVTGDRIEHLGSWISMLESVEYSGTVVMLVPEQEVGHCRHAQAGRLFDLLCFDCKSTSLQYETMATLLVLLERWYDSVLYLDFDVLVLEHPIGGVSDILCSVHSQPRPSMLFDRALTHPANAPDRSHVRFLRGRAGEALIRNFMNSARVNPFFRSIQSLAHMALSPTEDVAVPQVFWADLDGFGDLDSVLTLAPGSKWLGRMLSRLAFAPAGDRLAVMTKFCNLRLLPQCEGRDLERLAGPHRSNFSWFKSVASFYEHPREAMSQPPAWAASSQQLPGMAVAPAAFPVLLRPRIFQVGPSSAATTAIRDFVVRHGLRAVKSYYKGRDISTWIDEALQQGRPALYFIDEYDAYTDFLYPFFSRIAWCSESCESHTENVTKKVEHYLHLVQTLMWQYPYSKFIFNTRTDIARWLASQMYNCWPEINSKLEWSAWLRKHEECCNPSWGELGNRHCWASKTLRLQKVPIDPAEREDWAYRVCCRSLPTFRWIWHSMHRGVKRLFKHSAERVIVFPIEGDSAALSEFLGVEHKPAAWRKAHAG